MMRRRRDIPLHGESRQNRADGGSVWSRADGGSLRSRGHGGSLRRRRLNPFRCGDRTFRRMPSRRGTWPRHRRRASGHDGGRPPKGRRPRARRQLPPSPSSPPSKRLPAMRRWRPMRAIIGDEFRTPMLWCEFGSCIARYTSEDALGERDLRARALVDGLALRRPRTARLPCCTRHDPSFLVGRPAAPADRYPRPVVGCGIQRAPRGSLSHIRFTVAGPRIRPAQVGE